MQRLSPDHPAPRAPRLVRAGLCALTSLALLAPFAAADDGATREWNQYRGSAARSGWVAVEPVAAVPEVAWRFELPGPVEGEPVTWGGTVFVAARDKTELRLYAFDARAGTLLGEKSLGRDESRAFLATWGDRVLVQQDGTLQGIPFRDGSFGMPWRKKADFVGAPCVWDGKVLLRGKKGVNLVDAVSGRVITTGDGPSAPGKAEVVEVGSVAMREIDDVPAVSWIRYLDEEDAGAKDRYVVMTLGVTDINERKPELKGIRGIGDFKVQDATRALVREHAADALLAWCEAPGSGAFVLLCGKAEGWSGSLALSPDGGKHSPQMVGAPAVTRGSVYGFSAGGELRTMDASDGKSTKLAASDALPKGARPGPSCAWDGIVCFGNWAMDVSTGRTLWVLEDLPPIVATVPVTDGFVLLATETNELICLAEPGRATAAASGSAGGAATAGSEAAPPAPEPGDGVLLADGRKVLGTAEATGNVVTITPKDGKAFDVPRDEVAAVEADGTISLRGEEPAVLFAWQHVLDGMVVRTLAEQIEVYRNEKLVEASRRLLDEMRGFNAGTVYADEIQKSLSGLRENPNADLKMKRLGPEEEKRREFLLKAAHAAIDWCAANEYAGAATALLDHAQRIGMPEDEVLARAAELAPDAFPWKDAKDAGKQWLTWALEIVPAGGEFLGDGNPLRNRARNDPWNDDTLLFRTRNLLLFSRSSDPAVVGMCLRTGEGTVRALNDLLGDSAGGGKDLLDVRIHRNRTDYLEEKRADGGSAMQWSAGYYSPMEGVSRFYVPGKDDADATKGTLGRELKSTLSHELTHHWLSQRWLDASANRRGIAVPGYWIVEGFARFIEDQSQEMGRRRGRLDDETAPSLDSASQVAKQNLLLNTAELVGMDQGAFGKIQEKIVTQVKLRNTLESRVIDIRALFYEQSGGLVFFLMNKCGDETREALIKYMRQHYEGRSPSEPFKAWGFESGEDLHKKYEAYLDSLAE